MPLKRCATCHAALVFGNYKHEGDEFCSLPCLTASEYEGFCDDCIAATTADSGGLSFYIIDGVGFTFRGAGGRCPRCHSILQREWFWLIFPLIPGKWYRTRYQTQKECISRRLREERAAPQRD